MRAQRRLVLHKEHLTELRSDELANVVGGATTPVPGCAQTVVSDALACGPTVFRPCGTHNCTI